MMNACTLTNYRKQRAYMTWMSDMELKNVLIGTTKGNLSLKERGYDHQNKRFYI